MENYPDRISAQTLAAALALGGGSSPSPGKVYQFAGSVPFLGLPALSIDKVGNVYDVTDEFTSTADFTDGGGKHYSAGTNVAIANTGTDESPVLKYDCLMGDLSEILDDIDDLKDASAEYPIADSVSGDAVSVTGSADGYVQGLTVYGKSKPGKNLISGYTANTAIDDTTGAAYTNTVACITNKINVNTGTSYVLSGSKQASMIVAHGFDSNNTYLNYTRISTGVAFVPSENWSNVKQIIIQWNQIGEGSILPVNGQLEAGTEPTTYEPYSICGIGEDGELEITTANSDNTASTTATLTTGLPYCGIPVNSGETYMDGDGVKWFADSASVEGIVKRCEKVVFDGSEDENWELESDSSTSSSGSKRFKIRINPASTGVSAENLPHLICDNLTPTNAQTLWFEGDGGIGINASGNYILVRVATVSTVADLKTYLASNPVTVVYELAESYEIPLTSAELTQLRNLRTFDSTTNVTITDDPTSTVGYLLNTANGQAVADAIDNAITSVLNTSY